MEIFNRLHRKNSRSCLRLSGFDEAQLIPVPPIDRVFFSSGDLNLVLGSRDIQPHPDKLGASYQFVGPCLSDRRETADFELPSKTDGPLVYISLGTVFNAAADFYACCAEGLASFPGTVILSTGHRIPPT
ncbi:hypothetical protein OMP38_12190 [Cohnella ginsengisoli]|uniref:Uncharacterized protein n=1 Tax=Cohnella ginsengisoli TaxID=425004 RepID=A0A9X4KGJ1_9BACL|nr:hypothetical protein [Cohnella ginsengisoli]MDG0791546.1 hypothetical protein [Cohnella ginsengisoli]